MQNLQTATQLLLVLEPTLCLLPMPLFIPYAWPIATMLTLIFPLIGMMADWRRDGRVHPAWWWGVGIDVGVFAASMALAGPALAQKSADILRINFTDAVPNIDMYFNSQRTGLILAHRDDLGVGRNR